MANESNQQPPKGVKLKELRSFTTVPLFSIRKSKELSASFYNSKAIVSDALDQSRTNLPAAAAVKAAKIVSKFKIQKFPTTHRTGIG